MDVPVLVAMDYLENIEDLRREDALDVAMGVAQAFAEEGEQVIPDAGEY